MERSTLRDKLKSSGVQAAKVTGQSFYEFLRALITLIVGGTFLLYSYISAAGFVQMAQAGQLINSVLLVVMFLTATGASIVYVAIINGVIFE